VGLSLLLLAMELEITDKIEFIFEKYKTKLIHGHDKEKVATNVIGIKSALPQAQLMKEFFLQLISLVH